VCVFFSPPAGREESRLNNKHHTILQAETITADVKDGVFRILFRDDRLSCNQSWLNDPFVKAIDQAPHSGFGLLAKHSIEKEYNDEIDDVRQEIAEILALPDVVLDANFVENHEKLLKKNDQDWQKNFGDVTLQYFRWISFYCAVIWRFADHVFVHASGMGLNTR
jgi:hypothetical protein